MFTGIITHLGKIASKKSGILTIESSNDLIVKLSHGMSIAVDGICLTVINIEEYHQQFKINYMPETENITNIRYLKESDLVNLELPVNANTLLSGHIVQGHVDTVSQIRNIKNEGNSYVFTINIDSQISKYIVNKGSIAVNGISLTVIQAEKDFFTVAIIPHTWAETMLHQAKKGDYVNIEVDIIAKYLEKLLKH